MPLLDPSLQFYLCSHFPESSSKSNRIFFLYYLKAAKAFTKYNLKTIEALIQFRDDLKSNLSSINKLFKTNLKESSHFNLHQINNNYYEVLLNNMNKKYRDMNIDQLPGNYYTYRDRNQINFFQPCVYFPKNYCWYLSDSPIATLCINLCQTQNNMKDIFTLLNLDIDIMAGSGFTIALVVIVDTNLQLLIDLFNETIRSHKDFILEIHLNILTELKSKDINDLLSKFLANIIIFSNLYLGYIYIYSSFFNDSNLIKLIKNQNKKSHIYHFQFSEKLGKALRLGTMHDKFNFCHKDSTFFYKQKPFAYPKVGFETLLIRIILSNVSLYDTDDPENDVIPSCNSNFNFAYILKKNFLTWRPKRIPILFDDSLNHHHVSQKYIDFSDIHLIRPDFYVISTLYLTNTDRKTLKSVDSIQKSANKKLNEKEKKDFKKKNFFSLFKEKKIKKGLKYIAYAYQYYMSKSNNKPFYIHTNQIFTAFEACKTCLIGDKNSNKNADKNDEVKGVVYQVKTGEGKSCIVQLVAAVLALSNKIVHVTSSNINLANRDYCESFDFFKKIGLRSAVLLHQNEIPINENINNLRDADCTIYSKDYYPDEYFGDSLFENSSRMNYYICEMATKNKPNIIFSNFVNFESLYLRFMEMTPGYINEYFNNCSLIIDEADSILIDELTNGTILSRPMRSNGKDILFYVYRSYKQNKSIQEVYVYVKKQWPKCTNLELNDIKEMYEEIEIINQPEFTNGKKYSVETIRAKPIKKKDDDFDDDDDDFIFDEDNICDGKEHKKIVPFDYDHKGILEPNKEFSGFIQQFIAIKEMENNPEEYKDMIIKNTSMNYLYVSHPIFANLYNGICGLTGTIGNNDDKNIFREQYHLITKKIPSHTPNHRIELPIILCSNLRERNEKIVNEIIGFHAKEYPVLVIFQDLNEISEVANLLFAKGLRIINIFDGKKKDIKPDNISGKKGAISLGTNFCGRGTDIKQPEKPLHVVVSYYTSNKRIMHQAYGRTARQGSNGTVRVICLLDDYISPKRIKDEESTKIVLDEYTLKNQKQIEFIEEFRRNREWIFDGHIKSQSLKEFIPILREARINVNRNTAFKFEFPICMSIDTFLDIQAQKIFSIFNCPNCKYTWMLFQKYIREMILESWSIFIEQLEKKYRSEKSGKPYKEYLEEEFKTLKNKLNEYLPQSKQNKSNSFEIVPTFMHIFNIVVQKYQGNILHTFPHKLERLHAESTSHRFIAFFIGFRPYSLYDNPGARINSIDNPKQSRRFISDPELKYLKKIPEGANRVRTIMMSITEKVDSIFDKICNMINNAIGAFFGLKFFLRRTLGGCEFGICLDLEIENPIKDLNEYNCIIDRDPLLVFTISVKSLIPILAGILIIILICAKNIADILKNANISFLINKGAEVVSMAIQSAFVEQRKKIAEKLIGILSNIVEKQINKINKQDEGFGIVFQSLFQISKNKDYSKEAGLIKGLFGTMSFFKLKSNFGKQLLKTLLPVECILNIGFLILIILASFLVSFYCNRKELKYSTSKASENFEKDNNPDNAIKENEKFFKIESEET